MDPADREEARRALEHARGLLSQGRVVEALKVVLELLRGLRPSRDSAALAAHAAEAASASSSSPPSPADLARLLEQVSLVTEPAVAAAPPPQQQNHQNAADGTGGNPSLLAEAGRGEVAADAVADGSSVVCGRCGGVIAARRMAQHAHWCSSGGGGGEEDKRDGGSSSMEEG